MAESATDEAGATYTDADQLFRDVLPASPDQSVILAWPSLELIEAMVTVCWHPEDSPPIRLVASEGVLAACRDDFSLASRMADLEAAERLLVFAGEVAADGATVVGQAGGLAVILPTQDGHAVIPSPPGDVADAVSATHEQRLREGAAFDLRTPGLSRVRRTLEAELTTGMRRSFDQILELVEQREVAPLNVREMCLLAAGLNGIQLYEVSKWAEDVRLASKASFSRDKSNLEDRDILDAEKVPIEVGRPRLRLMIHESVAGLDLPELIEAAAGE